MKVTVIGSGYVGLVSACCFAEIGNEVVCVDNDLGKLSKLRQGQSPIFEEFVPELMARHLGKSLRFSEDIVESARDCDVIFLAVGTPQRPNGEADLSYVEAATREIAGACDSGFKLIVSKSTVPVYTTQWIVRAMLFNGADPAKFDVASNPEFFREGRAVTDFLYPDRIVIGANSDRAIALLTELYGPLTSGAYRGSPTAIPAAEGTSPEARLIVTTAQSAELIKHSANAYLAMKISFINGVSNICEAVGADITQVCEGIGSDSRIGPSFLKPGIGYGGSCFPKDVAAFQTVALGNGYNFRLLPEVIRINEDQRRRFVEKIRRALWTLKGKRVGALGLAFKGGTDDIRESPAIYIIQALAQEGAYISVYDPAAMSRSQECDFGPQVTFASDPYEAARNCDALLILTDWEEFAHLDLVRIGKQLKYPIIIDGRNLYDPQVVAGAGLAYISIGRAEVMPKGLHAPKRRNAMIDAGSRPDEDYPAE